MRKLTQGLSLNKQTLRQLTPSEMDAVRGGTGIGACISQFGACTTVNYSDCGACSPTDSCRTCTTTCPDGTVVG